MHSLAIFLLRLFCGGAAKHLHLHNGALIIAACGTSKWHGIRIAAALAANGRKCVYPAPPLPMTWLLKIIGKPYPAGDEQNPPPLRDIIKQMRQWQNAALVVFPDAALNANPKACGGGVDMLIKNIPGAKLVCAAVLNNGKIRFGNPIDYAPPNNDNSNNTKTARAAYLLRLLENHTCAAQIAQENNLTIMLAKAGIRYGFNTPLFSQLPQTTLTYRTLCRAAFAISGKLPNDSSRIGIMLPSSLAACALFYAAAIRAIVPVMLNPGGGEKQIIAACNKAQLKTVYTAALLLEKSHPAAKIAKAMRDAGINVVLLENLRQTIGITAKLKAALMALFPAAALGMQPGARAKTNDAACILFTSGSESAPKGAVLSHGNLIANCRQVLARLSLSPNDRILNTLPVFHSFGLLAGLVLPVAAGVRTMHYPTPLHYSLIPKIIYARAISIFFSADTFLANYAKNAAPEDMQSLRLVIAGAEKLKSSTRHLWRDKFNIGILEGYGVTETSPVIAFNRPGYAKTGTVGIAVPLVETRLIAAQGVSEGGVLHIRGPNVMRGYIDGDTICPPPDGWHNTGDIAVIEDGGYVRILGRQKRFIKIAGEMAALDGIEECLSQKWSDDSFAVVGIASESRGEIAALLTTLPPQTATRENITAALRDSGLPELWTPRQIRTTTQIPLLPTGKTDYPAVQKPKT